jgi:hypothetical protein
MSDEHERDDAFEDEREDQPDRVEDMLMAHDAGVRAFWLTAPDMQGLLDRLVIVLGEHMHGADELHITSNAMQAGWQEHPGRAGSLLRKAQAPWTQLHFEYSALVILRGRVR